MEDRHPLIKQKDGCLVCLVDTLTLVSSPQSMFLGYCGSFCCWFDDNIYIVLFVH